MESHHLVKRMANNNNNCCSGGITQQQQQGRQRRRRYGSSLLMSLFPILLAVVSVEGTVFNQHVSDNQFMTRAESPYTVHGIIEVEKSGTLTIESGVAINFYPGAGILVKGALIAKVRTTVAHYYHHLYSTKFK